MKEIKLTQGKVALVDDDDFEWLNQWKWHANYNKVSGFWTVARWDCRKNGRKIIYMHRQIMGDPQGMDVDHRDHDRFNNTRSNLRVCTHQQNLWNRRREKNSRSIYKGVAWHRGNKKWQANITVSGKQISLGYSDNEELAAKLYDKAAEKYYGEFAVLNFPPIIR